MNNGNAYTPSSFSVILCPRKSIANDKAIYEEFTSVVKNKPDISLMTESFLVHICLSSSTKVAADQQHQITLVLHGEIYGQTEENQADFLLKQYLKNGLDFSGDINGSFAIFLINVPNDIVALITDRINSRRVFSSTLNGNYWLSTSLRLQPTASFSADPVAVACCLANGTVHNNRTLFDGIKVLERASIHRLTKTGWQDTRYWSYESLNSYAGVDEEKVSAELSELLIESVKIRLYNNPRCFISLSGGHDASGVLGILVHLKTPNVECITYAYGKPKSSSDAYVAAQMAKFLGYPYRIVQSHKGDVVTTIKKNAEMGEGLSNFCDELDGWLEMTSEFSAEVPSALFAGDNPFGFDEGVRMYSVEDALSQHNQIDELDDLKWLSELIGEKKYRMLYDAWHQDIKAIVKRSPQFASYYDLASFVYLDQRIGNTILPWRQCFPGQFVPICEPFLDNSILDFMMKVPISMRMGRNLYRTTIRKMFPNLFNIERATTSAAVTSWRREFICQHSEIENLVTSSESKLDDIIPPGVILKLLRDIRSWKHSSFSPRILPGKIAMRYLKGMWISKKILSVFPIINHHKLLRRLLVIRLVLSR